MVILSPLTHPTSSIWPSWSLLSLAYLLHLHWGEYSLLVSLVLHWFVLFSPVILNRVTTVLWASCLFYQHSLLQWSHPDSWLQTPSLCQSHTTFYLQPSALSKTPHSHTFLPGCSPWSLIDIYNSTWPRSDFWSCPPHLLCLAAFPISGDEHLQLLRPKPGDIFDSPHHPGTPLSSACHCCCPGPSHHLSCLDHCNGSLMISVPTSVSW